MRHARVICTWRQGMSMQGTASVRVLQLQFGDHSVNTKNLTQSFGWTTMDAFTQHDVQELNRILSDKLEDKMKVESSTPSSFTYCADSMPSGMNRTHTSLRQPATEAGQEPEARLHLPNAQGRPVRRFNKLMGE